MVKALCFFVGIGIPVLTGCSSDTLSAHRSQLPPIIQPSLAPGETKKELMTDADRAYLQELLEPLIESEAPIAAYRLSEITDEAGMPICEHPHPELIGPMAQAHFQVLAACPYKIYTGKLAEPMIRYTFYTLEGDYVTAEMSRNPHHGVRIGGIAISAQDFHHFVRSLAHRKDAASAAQNAQH